MKLRLANRAKPYVMAHRGNRVAFPENTISAFQQAVLDGADIIETDLQRTVDGSFLCIHDATLNRTTNGIGLIAELDLDQARSYNAAAARPDLPPESIPTIPELAKAVPEPIAIAFELKSDAFLQPAVCQALCDEIGREGLLERTFILSFSFNRLMALRAVDPGLPIGWITTNRPWTRPGIDMIGPLWPLLLLNPMLALIAHLMGQFVCPLDPTPDVRLPLYRLLGCDAVLSDDPAKTAQALGRSQVKQS